VSQEHLALRVRYGGTQAHFDCVGYGDEDDRVGLREAERIEGKARRSYLFLLYLFDCADAVIGVNDFLAHFKTHHSPPVLQKTKPRRESGLGATLEGSFLRRGGGASEF
jgi:hypothetical protein